MASRYLLLMIFIALVMPGCNEKCKVTCGASVVPTAVGYSINELDSVIINFYPADGTFSNPVHSGIMRSNQAYQDLPNWENIPSSTSDTLVNKDPQFQGWYDYTYNSYDVELIVPSNNNRVYRFSKITLGGDQLQNQFCREGSPTPGFCSRYIVSYVLNGAEFSFAPNTNWSLYFAK